MYRKTYQLGNFIFEIESEKEFSAPENLAIFETEAMEPDFTILLEGDDKPEPVVLMEKYGLRAAMLKKKAIVLHSSFIDVAGAGIVFTAKSGVGKSTQADLWEKERDAFIVNGDRALLSVSENGITVGGMIYNGTSQICHNWTVPLKAIVLLGRGENRVLPVRPVDAFKEILCQCAFNVNEREQVEEATEIVAKLVTDIPVVRLLARPDKGAVEALEEVLKQI